MEIKDILITTDFDCTLTDRQGNIPAENLEAIEYFMAQGGSFTVNTGRSAPMAAKLIKKVPVNAPLLVCNGSVMWENGKAVETVEMDLPLEETMAALCKRFPNMNVDVQGLDAHYNFQSKGCWKEYCISQGTPFVSAKPGTQYGPFVKFALYGYAHKSSMHDLLYEGTAEEIAEMDAAEQWLQQTFGDKLTVLRCGKRTINVHAAGVSKLAAARRLQEKLGKKILICIGDAMNDVQMLDGADYAYAPADGAIADRYEQVCACAQGAVAEVIYKKIPKILANQP